MIIKVITILHSTLEYEWAKYTTSLVDDTENSPFVFQVGLPTRQWGLA